MADLLAVPDALAAVLAHARPLPAEEVEIEDALGRVLAEPVFSTVDLPPFPSSSMDGYAVRAADTPGTLRIVGKVAAGRPETRAVASGEAIDISTGGVVPAGADAVVPIERVVVGEDVVEIPHAVTALANIRHRGGDAAAGSLVLERGAELTAARLAALAACGIARVHAFGRPRVAVLATGSELRRPGEHLGAGQIYESNGIMLQAALEQSGAVVERLAAAEDTEAALAQALGQALLADVVVTSGGVSVGPHDLVRRVAATLGVEEVFWGVAMRPGKPLAFGLRGDTLVFGLPGNPVSSLVSCLLFVRPAVRALQGHSDPGPRFLRGALAQPVMPRPERDDYVRARLAWSAAGALLEPISGQESHMIVHMTEADAIVHVPRGTEPIAAGSAADYLPL